MKSLTLFSLKIPAISFLSNKNLFSTYLAKKKLFVCEKQPDQNMRYSLVKEKAVQF